MPTAQESQPENQATSSASEPDWAAAPIPEAETVKETVVEPSKPESLKDAVLVTGADNAQKFVMGYDTFHGAFCKAFVFGGHAAGLKTLVKAPEEKTCPDATRAMYDIILDTPALHFLISPEALWLQRAFAIGAFMVPVVQAAAIEMRMKREQGVKSGWFGKKAAA